MTQLRIPLTFLFFVLAVNSLAQVPLRLPAIISHHAVLQQSANVTLWGRGPGSFTVQIVGSWNSEDTVKVPIGADCLWKTSIQTPAAGGPYTLQFICGKQSITLQDILIGEVWLCSGQSNMEYNYHWGVKDSGDAYRNNQNNQLRFFQVGQAYDPYPLSDCQGEWKVCEAATAADFSAVGYFFGRRLREQVKVPVGMIGAYWGGTCIQAWMPAQAFERDPSLRSFTRHIEAYGWAPKGAAVLFNGMINPLVNYKLAGILWYQGEANVATESTTYSRLFTALISNWRTAFGSVLPFYFVQVAPWSGYPGINAALLREQQEKALRLPATGMVTAADLTDDTSNIHPPRKAAVGNRLADLALRERYGKKALQPYAPRLQSYHFNKNTATISVASIGKLELRDTAIRHFQLAGPDKQFQDARAVMNPDGTITLTAVTVRQPVAIRYCFTNTAIPGLFDANGLPLLPFRTGIPTP